MVVVVIIGVLVAIAVPIYGTVTRNTANQAHEANIRTLAGAASMHIANVGRGASSKGNFTGEKWDPLDSTGNPLMQYVQTWPIVPNDAYGSVSAGFPITVEGVANDTNPDGTYSVVITDTGAISVTVTDIATMTLSR